MAKKKKKNGAFSLLGFGSSKKKKKKTQKQIKFERERLAKRIRIGLAVIAVVAVFAGVGVGFVFLEKYVNETSPVAAGRGSLKLMQTPDWFNAELESRIIKYAGGGSVDLNENTAETLAENLGKLPWLYYIKVQTANETAQIYTKYRKPLAIVSDRNSKYYVAWQEPDNLSENRNVIVLDHFPIAAMPMVEIKGFATKKIPAVGEMWHADDIFAAIKLLELLGNMDKESTPDKPLLDEIASVDITNLEGRKHSRNAHILLWTHDGTEVRWGAALGEAARYLEASKKEKLNKLYSFYKEYGSLQRLVPVIELRVPEKDIPRP